MSVFRRSLSALLSLALLLSMIPAAPARAAEAESTIIDGEFQYVTSEENLYRYPYHYDESWFLRDSSLYQHDLTKMSLRVAMAAGDARSVPGYEKGYENIQLLMTDLGFAFSEEYSSYPLSTTTEHYDNIGYSIGSKTITLENGQRCTLLLLAIRGHNYGAEWGGNFRMGSGGTLHQGFSTAANKVLDGLSAYVASLGDALAPSVKLWVTGYSRGGAAANLVANSAASRISGLSQEDVYAYCFACPQNTTNGDSNRSGGIVNVINPIDLIPKFAMGDWGFSRYGTNYYLPSKETAADYAAMKSAMAAQYRNILTYQGLSSSEVDAMLATLLAEWDGQCHDWDAFLSDLSRVLQNRSNYVRYYQSSFMDIMAKEMGHASVDVNYPMLTITLAAILADEGTSAGIDMLRSGIFQYAHYMELCMAWLDAVDTLSPDSYGSYRRIFINGPVDLQISDSNVVSQVDENGQKILILPADGSYSLSFRATDSGLFSFAVTDYSLNSADTQRVICYHELPVSRGDPLTGTIQPSGEITLTLADGTTAAPAITQIGDAVQLCTVRASAGTGGSVTGGGSYLCGELAKVNAYASQGYGFAGWYIGDQLVSKENEYKFAVGGNTVVTARFVPTAEAIQGSWETDFTMAAADLGVQAPDSVLRCYLTFGADGSLTADWEAVDVSALRLYFHQMFVSAYYALAYGAGITDINEVEQLCMDSNGMGVSAYMDTIVTMEAITSAFTPATSTGAYMVSQDGRSVYLDICLLDIPSDPDVANSIAISATSMSLGAASFGKGNQTLYCTRD